jgi:hypothetical protein
VKITADEKKQGQGKELLVMEAIIEGNNPSPIFITLNR